MDNPSLLHQMKTRLSAAKGRWPLIAKTAGVDYVWLFKVAQGRIKDPGVSKVERVISALDSLDSALTKPLQKTPQEAA